MNLVEAQRRATQWASRAETESDPTRRTAYDNMSLLWANFADSSSSAEMDVEFDRLLAIELALNGPN